MFCIKVKYFLLRAYILYLFLRYTFAVLRNFIPATFFFQARRRARLLPDAATVLVGLRRFGAAGLLIAVVPTRARLRLVTFLARSLATYMARDITYCGRALRFAFVLLVIGRNLQER